jgi:hypothetical protein
MTYRRVKIEQVRHYVRCDCFTREEYNDALKVLSTIHDWRLAEIGILKCEISGTEGAAVPFRYRYAETRTRNAFGQTMQLLPRIEADTCNQARSKAVKQMLAWVKQRKGFARSVVPVPGEGTHDAAAEPTVVAATPPSA